MTTARDFNPLFPKICTLLVVGAAFLSVAHAAPPPAGKLAPRPLYRDPVTYSPTDPSFCFNAREKKWFMYYTARRATATNAPGVSWIYGSDVGIAESSDGGATWTYRGKANIRYGKDAHPHDYTYWDPEVIWHNGAYHMFLSYVAGIFSDWEHPYEMVHLTSKDGIKWKTAGRVDLQSDRTLNPCVRQLPNGTWRMWYEDDRASNTVRYADSPDLFKWEVKGSAETDFKGEAPKVFHWKDRYWLIVDCLRAGTRVWSSDDCTNWKLQESGLIGKHGNIVVSGDRAWWFYLGGPWGGTGRVSAVSVVEFSVEDGKLTHGSPSQPVYIDLKPGREEEK